MRILNVEVHPHLRMRMLQRGITLEEIEVVMNEGWDAKDAKPGTLGKVFVFRYNEEWEGVKYEQKEVSVYYKEIDEERVILTAKARYGKDFFRERGRG